MPPTIYKKHYRSKAPNALTAFPVATTLKNEYPVIEEATRLIQGLGGEVKINDKTTAMKGYFADPSFFKVFSFDLGKGIKTDALSSPFSMVISHEFAQLLFQDENPLGKTVEIFGKSSGLEETEVSWGLFTITGVISDKSYKSHLKFDVLVSSLSIPSLAESGQTGDYLNSWTDYQSYTYILLNPGKDSQDLNMALNDLASRYYSGPEVPPGFRLIGQELDEITPGILVRNASKDSLPMVVYYFLAFLGSVILFSACLNYTNLSIARALTRAKEIGVRKVTGARKKDLVVQFLMESLITALLALAFAFALLLFIKPAFRNLLVNQSFEFDLQGSVMVYVLFVGFALLVGFIAGAYPAIQLSSYSPTKALNNFYRKM